MSEKGFRLMVIGLLALQAALIAAGVMSASKNTDEQASNIADAVIAKLGNTPASNAPATTVSAQKDTALATLAFQQQLRQALRSELAQALVAQKSGAAASTTHTNAAATTPEMRREQELQFASSDAIVSSALSLGVWTERDTQALIPHLNSLSREQRVALLEKFHGAVNRQELRLEDIPPL